MIKKYNDFLKEELDTFYDDFEDSKKRLKLLAKFTKFKGTHKGKDIEVTEIPKKKFQPKVKQFKKTNNDKGIF